MFDRLCRVKPDYAASAPLFAAQLVSTQRQTRCSRRSRLKFFTEALFKKSRKAGSLQEPRQPRGVCHASC
ncbi:hypothetical protein DXC40_15745 [Anaerotruncus colihominis]|uniref:Uncharacterized protein n=1 Tax=Anaerotruncus colihominis TaxID=169435 RepID=A0A3E3IFE6_9FIRM|nr:hypothetical protein DXC40_15745 [Anaerotruncus colihominis]